MRVRPSQASATARARAVRRAGAFKSLESLLIASDALSVSQAGAVAAAGCGTTPRRCRAVCSHAAATRCACELGWIAGNRVREELESPSLDNVAPGAEDLNDLDAASQPDSTDADICESTTG